ncbi:Serine--tRNA ligase, mitochondrial [Tilletia horrida]|nr:Serine--tRNA ligase, mitochondrial [Tilletia horrida]
MSASRPLISLLSLPARQRLTPYAASRLAGPSSAAPRLRPFPAAPRYASSSPASPPRASDQQQQPPLQPSPPPPPPPPPQRPPSRLQASLAQIRALAQRHGSDPTSLVASFLVLHELTALLPLVLLFWIFQLLGAGQFFLSWLGAEPQGESGGQGLKSMVNGWVQEGMRRAERVGRRYGLFGLEKKDKSGSGSASASAGAEAEDASSPQSVALVGSFANAVAAYACVKALIPLRLAASVALAPAFARWTIEPVKRFAARWRGKPAPVPGSPNAASGSAASKVKQ